MVCLFSSRSAAGIIAGGLLLFLLLGLQSRIMNVPNQQALQAKTDENDKQVNEEVRLIIEDGDSLLGGADLLEPVKVCHFHV